MNVVQKKPIGRPRKAEGRRSADRQTMIDAAVALLREGGAAAFSARLVAERAGTAVGSVYTQFDSLEALRLEANAVTMRLLRDALAGALEGCGDGTTETRLFCLADAYLDFADQHRNAWSAMFVPRTIAAPLAIEVDIAALFAVLEGVLHEAGLADESEIPLLSRALWSSVHGMVYLGETGGLGPIHRADIRPMIRALVGAAVRGLRVVGRSPLGSV